MMRHERVVCVKSVWNSTIRHFSATPTPPIKGELKISPLAGLETGNEADPGNRASG
jgi:hypothetical protein